MIKLHGDYLDTRIKNTEAELATYDPALSALVDRVVDEYGLVICGWSADWDIALRAAIERCPSRRFTTYWATRSPLAGQARRLANHRKAEVIQIRDANQFLEGLWEKVRALGDMAAPHPLSPKIAVATVKRYLVDPSARIKLHDLVREETEKVFAELGPKNFPIGHPQPTIEEFSSRATKYEALLETLLGIVTTGCYWGDLQNSELWWKSAERLANQTRVEGTYYSDLDSMRTYPSLLLAYGGGIAAVFAKKYDTFAALMSKPRFTDGNQRWPLIRMFSERSVSFKVDRDSGRKAPIFLWWHLHRYFRTHFSQLIPDESDFRSIFDRFEYFFGLIRLQLSQGSVGWGGEYLRRYDHGTKNGIESVIALELDADGDNCPYLQAGLFDGSADKMKELQVQLIEKQKYILRF